MTRSVQDQPAVEVFSRQLVEELEARRMLSAGAGGNGVAVALIDSSLPNFNALNSAVSQNAKVITYDSRRDTAARVLGKLAAWSAATKTPIASLSILSHGQSGRFALGKEWISVANEEDPAWAKLRKVLADRANIYVFGCNVAASDSGRTLLNHLATVTGASVYGSTDITGKGGDWVLEASSRGATADNAAPLTAKSLVAWSGSLAAGITVTPSVPMTTTEAGGTATFTVVLDQAPGALDTVTVPISSSNTAEGTVSTASVTFDALNWNVPQTVTVTGVDDAVDDGDQNYTIVTGPATSTDTNYNGIDPSDVAVTNTDNDTAGFTVTPTSGLTTTEAGGQASFTVKLTSQPLADVTISIVSNDTTEGTVSVSSLTFTAANWNTAQTVTVTGVDDSVDDGNISYTIATGAATSGDANYNGMNPSDVTASNTDNDTAGFTVTPTSGLTTTEAGGTATFTVKLTSQPLADVTISLTSNDLTEGTVSPASLTFTSANWNVAQTVTVTGVDDFVDDGNISYSIVTGVATSADGTYDGIDPSNVTVSNTDNDITGINVAPTSGLTTTEAGGQASFTVTLNSQPTANVTIPISSSNTGEGTVSTSSLVFTPGNWNTPQTVTVTGADDAIDDGNVGYSIVTGAATSTDATYGGLNASDVSVTNTDDDTAGITVSPTTGLTTTEAGGIATFNIHLNSQPTANVTINLSSTNTAEGTVSPASLVFTPANWNVNQTVTVTGVDDFKDDGDIAYTITTSAATSADTLYSGMNPSDVSVTNIDDDTAGVQVTPTSGLTTTEAGGTATFTVVLTSQPSGQVDIPISSSNTAEGTVSPASLNFKSNNWNVPQTVTITGVNDFVDDGDIGYTIVTGAATASDPLYSGYNASDVSVTNTDNDTAGITVTPTSGISTTEAGGTTTFNVHLNSQPTANVVIGLSSSNTGEGTISTSSLTFTAANWNIDQTVTITGVNDFVDDGDVAYSVVTAPATSTDPLYSNMNATDVSVTNIDNDTAGITVTPTSGLTTTEAGGTATFTVVLTSQPTANVTIPLSSSNTAEGTISPSSLTFTAANWNVAQTVTLTGVDDFVDDGNVSYFAVTGAATSTDTVYSGMNASDVTVSNTDNDTAGITVSPTSGLTTTEAGGTANFTVRLNSQPTANVVIGISSSNTGEGTVSTSSLTFTAANWNVNQTVTVAGADDLVADGNVSYSIVTAAAVSADTVYSGMNASDVTVSNTDNDVAGITVSPTSGLVTTEAGGTATFTVVLTSQPTGNVTIPISSSNTGEGTVSASSLVFTSANWNVAQVVTVTGVDDFIDDGNIAYSIVTGAATSTDSGYNNMNASDVSVSNTDDDTAGITVTPTSGLTTTEAGSDTSFDVVLTSQPTANVTISITSGDLTEGTVSVSSLTFTPANWNVEQTVTVSSVDDTLVDGTITYNVVTGAAVSSDTNYSGMNPSDVSVSNSDNDPNGTRLGNEFRVNTTTANAQQTFFQSPGAVASDANGNFVVTWSSLSQDGSNWGVYAQLYDLNGNKVGSEFKVNTTTANEQQYARVAMAPTGEFVVTWASNLQDGSGWGVYMQRYTAAGVVQGTETRVNTTTSLDQSFPAIAMDSSGNYVIAWVSNGQDGSGDGVYYRKYNSAGVAQTGELRANTTTSGDQNEPDVAMDAAGEFLITWSMPDGDSDGVYAQRFNSAGTKVGGEFRVSTTTTKDQRFSTAAMDSSGNFVVTWSSLHQDGNGQFWGIFAKMYDSAGNMVMDEFKVNSSVSKDQQYSDVAMDSDGDFIITWQGGSRDGSGWGVFAQQFDPSGTRRGGEFRVNTTTSNDQQFSSLAMDATGDYEVVWTSTNQDGSGNGVYGQRYLGGNDAPVITVPASQSINEDNVLTFSTGNGNAISINDVDAGTGNLQFTLSVTSGLLSLSGTTGLSFSIGDGTSDTSMVFSGTLTDINNALQGMTYTPAAEFNGGASVSAAVSDLGNTGWGSPGTDSQSVAVTVNAVNDAPVNTVPGGQTINEDNSLVFSSGNGNRISINDIDAGSSSVRVTLTATHGTLTLNGISGLTFTTGDGTADATMTFTGTMANINAALNGLTFAPVGDYNGAASVTIVTNDQGNTGSGGSLSDTDAVALTINAVNDGPVNTVPGAQSTNEDTALVFSTGNGNLIAVTDVDAGTSSVRVTLTATNGTLTLNGTTGLSFTTGNGTANTTMTFTGTLTDINAALDGMSFNPTANYNGAATVSITSNDQGNTGAGGALSDSDAVNVTVNAVNDPPVNTIPSTASTNEDTQLVFSAGNGNQISIADVDAGAASVRVTLAVSNGVLTLSGTTGLTFTTGDGTADATMTFTGTLAAINNALDGLRYIPNSNYNGPAVLQITTNDQGNTGGPAQSDTDVCSITVNAVNNPPVNTVPGGQSMQEEGSIVFSTLNSNPISISDLDANGNTLQMTLSGTGGTITLASLTGLTFTTGDGTADATMTFTGTLADINAALDGLTFQGNLNFSGAGSLQITTSDLGNTGLGGAQSDTDSVAITVDGINDPPAVNLPGAQSTNEDTSLVFSSGNGNLVSITDVDAASGAIKVTLNVTHGTLSLSQLTGLTFITGDGVADSTLVFTGTLANVNAALAGMSFDPAANYNGPANLSVSVDDQGNTGTGGALTDSGSVAITLDAVNDAPVNNVPGAQNVIEDTDLVFSAANGNAISVSDVDAGTDDLTVTLTVDNGLLTLGGKAGLTFAIGNGTSDTTMTFTGTLAAINAALDGLTFAPDANYNGNSTLQISTSDNGHNGPGGTLVTNDSVAITVDPVNDPPIATVPGTQSTNEDTDLVFSVGGGNGITISDVDAGGGLVNVTISVTHGTLMLASTNGLTFVTGDGSGDVTMTFHGSLNRINAALDGLTFSPDANYNGIATLQIDCDDAGNSGSGGPLTTSDSVDINVGGVDDAPVNTVPSAQSVNEDAALVFSAANGNLIAVSDVDAAGSLLQVTLSVTNGRLTLAGTTGLSFTTGDGTGDATMVFTGTLADINAALNGLSFTPNANYYGGATLQISTDDQGHTGAGGPLSDTDSVAITVNPVNDAPVNTVPLTQTINEDTVLTFSSGNGNAIRIADVDADPSQVQITLTAANGVLTLSGTTGLTFTTGDGVADGTLVFTGTLSDINAALEGMTFSPNANFNGTASVQITANDQGSFGAGGALSDSDTVNITVNPVNDAPTQVVPPAQTVDEDTNLVFSSGNGNAISINDVDATTVRVTLSVTNGTLTLAQTSGLTFITGDGTGDATLVFTGSVANINAALDGIFFRPAANYFGGATLSITTNDQGQTGSGGALSASDTVAITVNSVNDAPVITLPGSQTVAEDDTLTFSALTGNGISISDIDAGNGQLRVILSVSNGTLTLGMLTGLTFDNGDGTADTTMTFTGTRARINAALEGMIFAPNADYFGPAQLDISVNDNGHAGAGGPQTTLASLGITVSPVNDPPVLDTSSSDLDYTENDPATPIDPGLKLKDVDDANLESATVTILNYVAGEDVLGFVDQNGISGSFDATSGVLTLTGTATVAQYQAALRSVTYLNTSDDPTTDTRAVRFVVNDGVADSNPGDRAINIASVNDAPTANPLVIELQEDAGRSTADLWKLFNDIESPDSDLVFSVTGKTNGKLFSGISIDPATGKLILDSAQDAFGHGTITVQAKDQGGLTVETTIDVTINPVNDAPIVSLTPGDVLYADPSVPLAVDPALSLADVDNTTLIGASIRIKSGDYVKGSEFLTFTSKYGITGAFDADSGTLTLSGSASLAQYEEVLRTVSYSTLAAGNAPRTPREIEFSVNDGAANSAAVIRTIAHPDLGDPTPPDEPLPPPPPPPPPPDITVTPPVKPRPPVEPIPHTPPSSGGGSDLPTPVPEPAPQPPPKPPEPVVVQPSPKPIEVVVPPAPIEPAPAPAPAPAPPPPVVAPPPPPPPPVVVAKPTLPPSEKLWHQLDQLAKEMGTQTVRGRMTPGTVASMTTTLLSVGYVIWCLRGGSLVATLLTTLPLWRWLDPLPILDYADREREKNRQNDADEERLQSMMD